MNFKAFKSTILGLVLIGVMIYLLITGITTDYWLIGGLGTAGVLLLFTPDTLINFLEMKILGRELFKDKDKENGSGI